MNIKYRLTIHGLVVGLAWSAPGFHRILALVVAVG
jgi:hypothetical protein